MLYTSFWFASLNVSPTERKAGGGLTRGDRTTTTNPVLTSNSQDVAKRHIIVLHMQYKYCMIYDAGYCSSMFQPRLARSDLGKMRSPGS